MIAVFDIEIQPLEPAFERAPDAGASIVQQTSNAAGELTVVLNVVHGQFSDFEAGLDADDLIARWDRFSAETESRRYRITLTERGRDLSTYSCWAEDAAVFLDGTRRCTGWRFKIQFPDEASLTRYVDYCEDEAIPLQPIRLSRTETATETEQFGLTRIQAQTLSSARERGFFEVPRGCTLEELATDSDITHQALSERLRRGMESLVESTLR